MVLCTEWGLPRRGEAATRGVATGPWTRRDLSRAMSQGANAGSQLFADPESVSFRDKTQSASGRSGSQTQEDNGAYNLSHRRERRQAFFTQGPRPKALPVLSAGRDRGTRRGQDPCPLRVAGGELGEGGSPSEQMARG